MEILLVDDNLVSRQELFETTKQQLVLKVGSKMVKRERYLTAKGRKMGVFCVPHKLELTHLELDE